MPTTCGNTDMVIDGITLAWFYFAAITVSVIVLCLQNITSAYRSALMFGWVVATVIFGAFCVWWD